MTSAEPQNRIQNSHPDLLERSPAKKWLFIIIPLLWLGIYFLEHSWDGGAAYIAGTQDPSYAYLFNGLAFAMGHWPPMCVHPGTPVISFVAISLRFFHPFLNSIQLAETVINNSEYYLAIINLLLLLIFLSVLAVSGWKIADRSRSNALGLLFQMAPLLMVQGTAAIHGVRPEIMLLTCGVGISMFVTLQALQPDTLSHKSRITWAILMGLGAAAKVHFIPLEFISLLLIPKWRPRIELALVALATFLVATIPSWPAFACFGNYVWQSATHTGSYGAGESGLPNPSLYLSNFYSLIKSDKAFFLLLIASASSIFLWIRHRVGKAICAILFVQICSVLIIALHPMGHYLTSAISLTGALVALIFAGARSRPNNLTMVLPLSVLVLLAGYKTSNLYQNRKILWIAQDERNRLSRLLRIDYENYEIAPYFQCSNLNFALYYGNSIAGNFCSPILNDLHRNILVYDKFKQGFYRGDQRIDVNALRENKRGILMTGNRMNPSEKAAIEKMYNFHLSEVFGGWIETAYRIRWNGENE